MFEEVDKLQSQVDELLDLCSEAGAMELPASKLEEKKQLRLGAMILRMQDGDLEERYIRRLEKWLNCDKKAMHYYVDFQDVTAMLCCHYNRAPFRRVIDFVKSFIPV